METLQPARKVLGERHSSRQGDAHVGLWLLGIIHSFRKKLGKGNLQF